MSSSGSARSASAVRSRLRPPNDCRLTLRCLHECFGFSYDLAEPFERFKDENSCIRALFGFAKDEAGNERGERILTVKSRPVYALHCGRSRGATWYDSTHPPQPIVWLLRVERHDERHKGSSDAYDTFGRLEKAGELFPEAEDYKLLELHSRLADARFFVADVARDASAHLPAAYSRARSTARLAGIPVRTAIDKSAEGMTLLWVAVSRKPIVGERSGLQFPLDDRRWWLLVERVRQSAQDLLGGDVLADEAFEFPSPGGIRDERVFLLLSEN